MKLLLIYPPDRNLLIGELPKILEEGIGFVPPIGLLYVAAVVKQRTRWEVEFMDCAAERLTYEQIGERIRICGPDAVGITVTNNQLLDCLEIARIVKKINPAVKVMLGGAHVHIYPRETLAFDFVDFVFTGEAEETAADLLNRWDDPAQYRFIPGLYYKISGQIMFGPPAILHDHLDSLPFPAREVVKQHLYVSPLTEKATVTSMITSRGCPFQCIYCARIHLGKHFRARSADNVVDEMRECAERGIEYIRIYDDTFTLERKRVLDICAGIRQRKLKIKWDIRAHVNTIDAEMLCELKKSGCELICYGIESGNNEILKRMKKGITKEKAAEVIGLTKKAGIRTLAYFMLGFPAETREQMRETIDFSKKLDPDFCHYAILVPFPCTAVYEEGLARGIFKKDFWREFAANPTAHFKPPVWVEKVPEHEMRELLEKAYKEFYFRPVYLMRRLLAVRSWGDFLRKTQTGLRLFHQQGAK